ncbi:Prolyl oligopeptidase family protein [Aquisphaera giovannonii]|uniref:Prolyl oligopeptidase family protein n=1 Tax=Aquisphaera giovannonii TaxID=406548 RepID=A0A5B9W4R4_9BACT|nr:alpha/beta hydrolase [Aquisphaera giovannonii]QEH35000.1 Prolyl oligopeptidase family protein [Aquisphaera giovannonii]
MSSIVTRSAFVPVAAVILWLAPAAGAQTAGTGMPSYERIQDVVYGRKHGMALTLDVFRPKAAPANGVGLVWVVSGGWYSSHDWINGEYLKPFLDRGYTVFAVVHGSQPRFAIPDVLQDMNRAVRFIRHNAKAYGVDPDRLGIFGGSAGGHLSLMQGLAGAAGDPKAKDPVEAESSRVACVACFFPPTDFLNYGEPGKDALESGVLKDFQPPFDFQEADPASHKLVPIADRARRKEIMSTISPVTHASSDDPPVLIHHGDADALVPIQQSELVVGKLKAAGVEAVLVPHKGAQHGWGGMEKDLEAFADWFDAHLRKGR